MAQAIGNQGTATAGGGRRWTTAVVALAVIVASAVGLVLLRRDSDSENGGGADGTARTEPAALSADAAPVLPDGDVLPRATTARTPIDAVDGFLAAEKAGTVAAGFDYLSDADRVAFATAAGWEAAHAELLPPVRDFEVGEVTASADRAEVAATLRFTPTLDEFVGLVPAEATATWVVRRSGEAWGVALDESTIVPVYADDAAAPAAVRAWAETRQQCETAGERDGTLLGFPGIAADLCGTGGNVAVGSAAPLAEVDASAFTAAFGGDVVTWARVVPVAAPQPLRAVVAPVGDEWLVIGVLGPGLGGS